MRLLYITAQHEGPSHSSISGVFGTHLRRCMPVVRVFVTPDTAATVRNGDDILVPETSKARVFEEIRQCEDLAGIDLVLIRNYYRFLKQALRTRRRGGYRYLIGFQQSYPFAFQKYYLSKKHDTSRVKTLVKYLDYRRKALGNRLLLSRADFFVPISTGLHQTFHAYYRGSTYPLGMGVDPDLAVQVTEARQEQRCRFLYIGTVDPIREFATILEGFAGIQGDWSLDIYTRNVAYCRSLLPGRDERISVHEPVPREQLFAVMGAYDVGIASMPDNPVWQTASPTKLMEYYACGIPCIMSPIPECRELFEDRRAGWFCEFRAEAIRRTLEEILSTPKAEIVRRGHRGRTVVLEKRNYRTMSEGLFDFFRQQLDKIGTAGASGSPPDDPGAGRRTPA